MYESCSPRSCLLRRPNARPLQGAFLLASGNRYAGGQQAARNPGFISNAAWRGHGKALQHRRRLAQ